MYNCTLDSLRGYSHRLPNSIINCPQLMEGGMLMPLANSLQFFNGKKTMTIYESKREISALDMRHSFIVIGQKASPGQLISAILLDTTDLSNAKVFNYQKSQITLIAVSSNGEFFCSVGNSSELIDELILIEVNNQSEVGTKIFFSKSFKRSQGKIMSVKFSNHDPTFFVVLCVNKIIFFRIDIQTGAVEETVPQASRVRQYNNFIFSPDDSFLYCCSTNGDLSEISVQEGKQTRIGPRKRVITKGITNLKFLEPNHLIICGKEGMLAIVELQEMRLMKQAKLQEDEIMSLSEFQKGEGFIATNKATIYRLHANTLDTEVFYSCCSTKINSLVFLKGFHDIFGTTSGGEIVIWKTKTLAPALRISVPKIVCLSLNLPKNGKYIVSGWSDDCVRIFSPKNGKLLHRIRECNLEKVTDITSDEDSTQIICGGENGVIRLWNLVESKIFGLILGSLAFHMQRINRLRINPFDQDQMVSCCDDGSYAVWILSKFQMRYSFRICNFIKDIHFVDELKIRLAGSGNIIYECFACDGIIKRQIQVVGTCINTMVETVMEGTKQNLLFFGGDCPQLTYFDLQNKNPQLNILESYGQISCMEISANKKSIIVGTNNGVIISYSIFATKQSKEDDKWV